MSLPEARRDLWLRIQRNRQWALMLAMVVAAPKGTTAEVGSPTGTRKEVEEEQEAGQLRWEGGQFGRVVLVPCFPSDQVLPRC